MIKKAKNPDHPIPTGLSDEAGRIWCELTNRDSYVMDAAGLLQLRVLCEAWDRRAEARKVLAKDGPLIVDRFGVQKAHPALAIERDQSLIIQRAWRLLGYDLEGHGESPRKKFA